MKKSNNFINRLSDRYKTLYVVYNKYDIDLAYMDPINMLALVKSTGVIRERLGLIDHVKVIASYNEPTVSKEGIYIGDHYDIAAYSNKSGDAVNTNIKYDILKPNEEDVVLLFTKKNLKYKYGFNIYGYHLYNKDYKNSKLFRISTLNIKEGNNSLISPQFILEKVLHFFYTISELRDDKDKHKEYRTVNEDKVKQIDKVLHKLKPRTYASKLIKILLCPMMLVVKHHEQEIEYLDKANHNLNNVTDLRYYVNTACELIELVAEMLEHLDRSDPKWYTFNLNLYAARIANIIVPYEHLSFCPEHTNTYNIPLLHYRSRAEEIINPKVKAYLEAVIETINTSKQNDNNWVLKRNEKLEKAEGEYITTLIGFMFGAILHNEDRRYDGTKDPLLSNTPDTIVHLTHYNIIYDLTNLKNNIINNLPSDYFKYNGYAESKMFDILDVILNVWLCEKNKRYTKNVAALTTNRGGTTIYVLNAKELENIVTTIQGKEYKGLNVIIKGDKRIL